MIATAHKLSRTAQSSPRSTSEVRQRAAEIRRNWNREERLCRMLQAKLCQHRLFGALLSDAA